MNLNKFVSNHLGLSTITVLGTLGVVSLIVSLVLYQFTILDKDSQKLRIIAEKRILTQKILLAAEDPLSYECTSANVTNPCTFKSSFLTDVILKSSNTLLTTGKFEVIPKEGSHFLVDDSSNIGKWFKAILQYKSLTNDVLFSNNIEVRLPADYFQVSSYIESGVVKGAICPIEKPFFYGFDPKTGQMICTGNQNFRNCPLGFVHQIDGKTLQQTCIAFNHSTLEAPSGFYIKDGSIHREGAGFKMETISRSGDPWEEIW